MAQARDGRQLSFADVAAEGRRRKLGEKRGRHLAMIGELVPWEDFRPVLEAVWRKAGDERKSAAGRKPWDAVLMFKAIVLGALYNLSDEALEHEMGDRLTFMQFLGLGLEDRIPDATTVWLYRERLAKAGVVEKLFEMFDAFLRERGYQAMGGQIIDASIVPVPTQRNSKEENAEIKAGDIPAGWVEGSANKLAQKNLDARWTKRNGVSHYGYKNHVSTDRRHKLVRRYSVTDAATHDSQVIGQVLDPDNTAAPVWADKAYRSREIEALLAELGYESRIMRKGSATKELTRREKQGNGTKARVRARVEHVFGSQANDMGGTLVRSIGAMRARAHVGLRNLAYNMRRFTHLERAAPATA
ncbi:MAG: IS5 family transposase [Acidobacteriota bacterium]|nr:IS5 family transposase [Acidobacteriota bacterium]